MRKAKAKYVAALPAGTRDGCSIIGKGQRAVPIFIGRGRDLHGGPSGHMGEGSYPRPGQCFWAAAYRRTSTPRDPQHMSYYVATRVWPSSGDVYEITVPRSLYMSLADVPVIASQWRITRQQLLAMPAHGALRLAMGQGRLGVAWLNGVIGTASTSDAARQKPETRAPKPQAAH